MHVCSRFCFTRLVVLSAHRPVLSLSLREIQESEREARGGQSDEHR